MYFQLIVLIIDSVVVSGCRIPGRGVCSSDEHSDNTRIGLVDDEGRSVLRCISEVIHQYIAGWHAVSYSRTRQGALLLYLRSFELMSLPSIRL